MKCQETNLLHAFMDGELDAGQAHEAEAHLATCRVCANELRHYREIQTTLSKPEMRYQAPLELRKRIESALPRPLMTPAPKRPGLLPGFALGSIVSAALAATLALFVVLDEQNQLVDNELVSAHLRSLQSGHLIDVTSSDQHTVKPWFNGRLEVSPPVIDLAAEGFMLVGGRLDYLAARPVATLVYKRRAHVINVFITQASSKGQQAKMEPQLQGFHVWRWSSPGFSYSAVSDINPAELQEFGTKFQAAVLKGES
jgi:anti-sigma factor RsiW